MINWHNLSISVTNEDDTDLFQIVNRLPNLSKLRELIADPKIRQEICLDESCTLFAPTNFAIERIGDKIEDIRKNKTTLKSFLKDHIVKEKFLFSHLRLLWNRSIKVESLNGELITLNTNADPNTTPQEFSVMNGKAVIHDIEFKSQSKPKVGGSIYLLDSIINHKGTLSKTYILKCIL